MSFDSSRPMVSSPRLSNATDIRSFFCSSREAWRKRAAVSALITMVFDCTGSAPDIAGSSARWAARPAPMGARREGELNRSTGPPSPSRISSL